MSSELLFAARRVMELDRDVGFMARWWRGCLEGEDVVVGDDELSGVIVLWESALRLHRELTREGSGGQQCATSQVIAQLGRAVYRACEVVMFGRELPGIRGSVIAADQVRRVKLFWRLASDIAREIVRVASGSEGAIDVHEGSEVK